MTEWVINLGYFLPLTPSYHLKILSHYFRHLIILYHSYISGKANMINLMGRQIRRDNVQTLRNNAGTGLQGWRAGWGLWGPR